MNGRYYISTDLTSFDELYYEIMHSSSFWRTYYNCTRIFEMYDTDIQLVPYDDTVQFLRIPYAYLWCWKCCFRFCVKTVIKYLRFKHPERTGAKLESSAGYHTWFDIDTDIP